MPLEPVEFRVLDTGVAPGDDLALLEAAADPGEFSWLNFARASSIGESVRAAGFPLSFTFEKVLRTSPFDLCITPGVITSIRSGDDTAWIQHECWIERRTADPKWGRGGRRRQHTIRPSD